MVHEIGVEIKKPRIFGKQTRHNSYDVEDTESYYKFLCIYSLVLNSLNDGLDAFYVFGLITVQMCNTFR